MGRRSALVARGMYAYLQEMESKSCMACWQEEGIRYRRKTMPTVKPQQSGGFITACRYAWALTHIRKSAGRKREEGNSREEDVTVLTFGIQGRCLKTESQWGLSNCLTAATGASRTSHHLLPPALSQLSVSAEDGEHLHSGAFSFLSLQFLSPWGKSWD